MSRLHRTPVHASMLRADLVALYELRDAGLIHVSAPTVTVTGEGADRLAEWEQVRA